MEVSSPAAPAIVFETPVGERSVPRLELTDWATRFGLVAGITTRQDGFSLGLWSEEPVERVMTRWRDFRRTVAPRFPSVILGHQVHGTEIRRHEAVPPGWLLLDGIDGHLTGQPGVLLTVTAADCIPVYLASSKHGLVGLLHAGWRGIAGGVLERALEITRHHGVPAGDIVMHCGVGICGMCYQVGSEVVRQLSGHSTAGGSNVDLRSILAARAKSLGLGEVTISGHCTAHHNDRFFSHRASGGRDGRMVAYLGIPLP